MVSGLDTYTSYNSTTKKGGILQGDSIRTVLDDIKTALVTTPKGFTGSDTLTLAAQLGLAFDKTGKLSLIADSSQATTSSDGIAADVDDLADALSKNFDAALSLIGAQATGASDSNYISFVSASATSTAAGAYSVKVDYNDSGDITTARVSGDGGATWQYMTVNGNDLLMTSGPLAGLTLTSVSDGTSGAHTQTANVRVRQGFAGEVYDATKTLLDSTTGIFALEKQRFQDQYDSYTKKISDEQTRLDNEQTQLKAKYARMEATLAQISGQTAGLQSLLSSTYSTNNNSSSSSSSSGV
jgi:flagellar hook-associated protein 2